MLPTLDQQLERPRGLVQYSGSTPIDAMVFRPCGYMDIGGMDWTGLEWNGMEWNGMAGCNL